MKIKSLTVVDDNGVEHTFTSKSLVSATTVEEAEPVVEVKEEPAPVGVPEVSEEITPESSE